MTRLLATLIALGVLAAGTTLPARAAFDDYTKNFDQTVQAAGVSSLDIAGRNGNVRLYDDGGSAVRIHAVLKAKSESSLEKVAVNVSRSGDAVRIESRCGSTTSFLFWTFADCDVEYEVHYPHGLALQIHNENGNIEVSGASGTTISNGNGNVTVAALVGNASVSTRNGNVLVALAGNWRGNTIAISTHAGNATLRVPRGFNARLDAHTRMGQVTDNANLHGGPVTVTASTTFGNVEVERE